MKRRILTAALAVCASLIQACAPAAARSGSSANGSIAISHDDALLYAADSDLDTVFVVNAATNEKMSAIKVGRQPEKVLVGVDDTVFVSNRMDRSVSVIRRGDTSESARIATAVEPCGLAQSADGKTLFVVNATSLTSTDFGVLQAFDTATLALKWELPVGREPRGIAVMPGDIGMVSLFKDGEVVQVDLAAGTILKSAAQELHNGLNASSLGIQGTDSIGRPLNTGLSTAHVRGLETILPSHDGKQVYVAGLVASDGTINTRTQTNSTPKDTPIGNEGSGGYGGLGRSCLGVSSVAAPAMMTLNSKGEALVDDINGCADLNAERPSTIITTSISGDPVQGPAAATLDATGRFLLIANRNSNNVAIVPTSHEPARGAGGSLNEGVPVPTDKSFSGAVSTENTVINVGGGPTGIVAAQDGRRVWVYNSFDHSVSRLEKGAGGGIAPVQTTVMGADVLSPQAAAGRRLFFSAVDSRMNNPGTGISCATCHLEGREDGHVWNFIDGPRQTPSLAGRMINQTAPFHWNGEFPDLMAFMTHTVTRSMGGSGVTPAMEEQIAAFIATLPAADNPMKTAANPDAVQRGRAAFVKADCNSCHNGAALTDNSFADVGTFVSSGTVTDDMKFFAKGGLNTPSLLGVARSAPFLHDGSAVSLKARILQGKEASRHGKTAQLSDAEVDDLVSYLQTL